MLRTDGMNVTPLNDPATAVVVGMDTGNVDTVLIAGRVMKRHESCCTWTGRRCDARPPNPGTSWWTSRASSSGDLTVDRETMAGELADLGARLREERERARISQRELARRLGVSASLISQIESGQSKPR